MSVTFDVALGVLQLTPLGAALTPFTTIQQVAQIVQALTRKGTVLPQALHALTAAGHDPVVLARLAVQAQRAYGRDNGAAAMLALAYQRGDPSVLRAYQGGLGISHGLPDDPRAGLALRLVSILDGETSEARYALGRLAYEAGLVPYPNKITDAHVRALRAAMGV